jgi:hypothetical protein
MVLEARANRALRRRRRFRRDRRAARRRRRQVYAFGPRPFEQLRALVGGHNYEVADLDYVNVAERTEALRGAQRKAARLRSRRESNQTGGFRP